MSNLFKSTNVKSCKEETRLIDNNELISAKIQQIKEMLKDSLEEVNQEEQEVLDNFTEGIDAETVSLLVSEREEANSLAKAENVLENAKAEADKIIENAKLEAEKIITETLENARQEAYETAIKEAKVEADRMRAEVETLKEAQMEEYKKKLEEMEPMLVEAILKVFNRVTNVLAEDKKDMILHLVNSVMTKTELSRNFIIRVSKDDYHFLIDSREKIYGALLKDANIEIIEDLTMKRNQCIIETDGGIYECSLDIQLENLTKDIKTLACLLD